MATDIQESVDSVHTRVLEQLNQSINMFYCMFMLNECKNNNGKEYVKLLQTDSSDGIVIQLLSDNNCSVSIQQLSGGQRALLGLSLVFAILTLNQQHVERVLKSAGGGSIKNQKQIPTENLGNSNPLYILDECDAALDEHNQKLVSSAINKLFHGKTQVLCVSHHAEFQKLATSVISVQMHADGYSRITTSKMK